MQQLLQMSRGADRSVKLRDLCEQYDLKRKCCWCTCCAAETRRAESRTGGRFLWRCSTKVGINV